MVKKILVQGVMVIMALSIVVSLTACGDKDWSKDFDLSDEKITWDESSIADSEYAKFDRILITFKQTKTDRQIDSRDLKLSNVKSFSYIQATLEDGSFGWMGLDGRQTAIITLNKIGKEKILEAIRHLEKLEFIKSAEPAYRCPMAN